MGSGEERRQSVLAVLLHRVRLQHMVRLRDSRTSLHLSQSREIGLLSY